MTAQDTALVNKEELIFINQFEKESFEYLNDNEENTIRLLLSLSATTSEEDVKMLQQRLQSIVEQVKSKEMMKKTEIKTIRQIYTLIHDAFFKKYEENVFLTQTLKDGTFNCVTATAIYALVFNRLNIPIEIKETPTHVYLIAYPQTSKIVVETTMPADGLLELTDSFKKDFVKLLKDNKLIDSEEFSSKSTNALFDKYYFENSSISLKQLAALQYYNMGVFLQEQKKLMEAISFLEKAYHLYSSNQIRALLLYNYAVYLDSQEVTSTKSLSMFFKILNHVEGTNKKEMLIYKFAKVIDASFSQDKQSKTDSLFQVFYRNTRNEDYKKEISYIFHYEKVRNNYQYANKFNDLLISIDKCLEVYPNKKEIKEMTVYIVMNKITKNAKLEQVEEDIEKYKEKYPFLMGNITFSSLQVEINAQLAAKYFQADKVILGEDYLEKVEKSLVENPDIQIREVIAAYAFAEGGAAYFRKNQIKKAKDTIKRGFKYAPDNQELKERLKIINQYDK